jgi:proton-dependent oligopeptide transporter, POT family
MVGYVGGLYSSLPTTTFWLIHAASAAFGLVAFAIFKIVIGKRMEGTPQDQAASLS